MPIINPKLVGSFALRGGAACIGFLHGLVVIKIIGVEEGGLYFLSYSFVLFLSAFGGVGLNTSLLKIFATRSNNASELNRSLGGAVRNSTIVAVIISVLLVASSSYLELFLNKPSFKELTYVFAPSIIFLTLLNLISGALQGLEKIQAMIVFQNILPFLFVISACLISDAVNFQLKALHLVSILSLSFLVSLCLAYFYLMMQPIKLSPKFFESVRFDGMFDFWVIQMAQVTLFTGTAILCSKYLGEREISVLYTAQRISATITFVLLTVSLIVAPRMAVLYRSDDEGDFVKYVSKVSRIVFLSGLPFVLICLLFSKELLSIFDPGFIEYGAVLSLLVLGHFAALISGPVIPIMTMTGIEGALSRINYLMLLPSLIIAPILTYSFGIIGAAVAFMLIVSVQNLWAVFVIKKNLGFYPIYGN
jgi:O-antigen/teichoic acid export membrane protein